MPMRRSALVFVFIVLAAAVSGSAQVSESATGRQLTITGGGFGSAFNPNDGNHALYGAGTNHLVGLGTFVDVHFTHWIQIQGEARWLRFDQYAGEHMDNYFIGPKVPIHQFGRTNVYGKVMIGMGKMTFPHNFGYGTFTALAYGGGLDYKLSPKLTVRAVDFEFQQWPLFLNNTALYPYGVSVGLGYKVF